MEKFIKSLAKGAGKILRRGYNPTGVRSKRKGAKWDVVTRYDKLSEKFLMDAVKKKYPDMGILSEESGNVKAGKKFWIFDPLDGTKDFSRGIPSFCMTIAIVQNDVVTHGAVYVVMDDELFYAERGKKVVLNNKRIRASREKSLRFAVGANDLVRDYVPEKLRRKVHEMLYDHEIYNYTSREGPMSLAYLAAGRMDYSISCGGYPWDLAAGGLIAKQAGATISDLRGNDYHWSKREIVAASPALHKKIIRELN